MRILFITEQFPYPLQDGGNLRTYHVLRALARAHDVTLVAHAPQGQQPDFATILPEVRDIHCVAKPSLTRRLLHSTLRVGLRRLPLFVMKNWSAPLLSTVDRLLASNTFDAIHCNHLDTACYLLRRNWPLKRVFDTHNCLSAMAQQVARETQSSWRRLVYRRESRLLARCEREVCLQMDANLVCSRQDAWAFEALGIPQSPTVIPNGVDIEYFSADPASATEPGNLVFTGAMNYFPNEQAVIWFCREVMPLLAEYQPSIRFFIVGKNPTAAVRGLHNANSVHVTGGVPDVREYVRRADLFVVPLRHGSGTRLKILEAFAMGKAVVSTRIGAEGIDAIDNEHLVLADTPQEIAGQIRRLLADQALRQQLGRSAQSLARREYGWERIGQKLIATYADVANATRISDAST